MKKETKKKEDLKTFLLNALFISFSFVLVTLSQPDWSKICCIITAACGYTLFWKGLLGFESLWQRFILAAVWFGGIEVGHLNWFGADQYVGSPIYVFLIILFFALGGCFAFLSLGLKPPDQLTGYRILGIAGVWTLFEWGRLFFLSGFSWDPIGLNLTATTVGMQLASGFGVFGLSYWVLFTNLFGLKVFQSRKWLPALGIWAALAISPYLFGWSQIAFHNSEVKKNPRDSIAAVLVQTSLYPEQKIGNPFLHKEGRLEALTPVDQWKRILSLLKEHHKKPVDLIAFSEAVVPYGTDVPLYPLSTVIDAFQEIYDVTLIVDGDLGSYVGNSFWAQALARVFNTHVVIGLEDGEMDENRKQIKNVFNAAFLFRPDGKTRERYEKRVLVPLGEYIPFEWCKKLLLPYGIQDSFTPGKEAKVFTSKQLALGLSICYEETYGHLIRENRLKGAQLLINLTNDVWYPHSRLPLVHYYHGRIRAVEAGLPVLRVSNTGVTCAIDSLGNTIALLPFESKKSESPASTLYVKLSTYCYPTLYTRYGDQLIVWLSTLSVFISICAAFLPFPIPLFQRIFKI